MEFSGWTPEYFIANESECLEKFDDLKKINEVPSIIHTPSHLLADGSLVRFRGMIQDMLNTEMYAEQYEVQCLSDDLSALSISSRSQNGKYIDLYQLKANEKIDRETSKCVYGERRNLILVSVPGVNEWVLEEERKQLPGESKPCASTTTSDQSLLKRSASEDDSEGAGMTSTKKIEISSANPNKSNSKITTEYLLNSPIPSRPSKVCIVKIYSDFESFSLNTIVDVIGFLSINPSLDGKNYKASEFENTEEIQAMHPPPSLIPRVHAIWLRRLQHINPLLENPYFPMNAMELATNNDILDDSFNPQQIFKELRTMLAPILFNDELATDYLIYHLLSTIYVRTDTDKCGLFTLNISQIPKTVLPEYTKELYEFLEMLLPASHYFPLTRENLNNTTFLPRKDFNTNKLITGFLQLAPHTHLTLDETRLKEGKLEASGVEGIAYIQHLIQEQLIQCDFQFYKIDYPVNLQILVLSEGKSMLLSNFHVPLIPDNDCVNIYKDTLIALKHFLKLKLNIFRKYLTSQKLKRIKMGNEIESVIQEKFVAMRNADSSIKVVDLHNLMVLSRLIGLAIGKTCLDEECFNTAVDMENERKARIKNLKKDQCDME